jgi:hypothetical protein
LHFEGKTCKMWPTTWPAAWKFISTLLVHFILCILVCCNNSTLTQNRKVLVRFWSKLNEFWFDHSVNTSREDQSVKPTHIFILSIFFESVPNLTRKRINDLSLPFLLPTEQLLLFEQDLAYSWFIIPFKNIL